MATTLALSTQRLGGGSAVYTLSDVYYGTAGLNPGDDMEIALQAASLSLSTGRYDYEIDLTAEYSTTASTTLTGSFDYLAGIASRNNATANPFGPGWSLDNPTRLWPVSGQGVILENPDGTSQWFADGTSGTYVTSAGEFATLTSASTGYTLTEPDGTKVQYDSGGDQTAIVDTTAIAPALTSIPATSLPPSSTATAKPVRGLRHFRHGHDHRRSRRQVSEPPVFQRQQPDRRHRRRRQPVGPRLQQCHQLTSLADPPRQRRHLV